MEEFIRLDLQRFADGGGAAGGGEGAGGTEGAATGSTGETAAETSGKGRTADDLSKVRYGKQDETTEAPEADAQKEEAPKPAPKRQSFDQIMKDPEYAREMQKRIDQAINKRFAKNKAAEEQNAKLMPALNLLSAKYGTEAGNVEALIEAINGDTDLIEQQAMDAGMEPDAYREFQRMQAELDAYKKAEEQRQQRERDAQTVSEWQRQAETTKQIFPGFDLFREIRNPQFSDLLRNGIDVTTAFKVIHQDEIYAGLIQKATDEARTKTVSSIAAKSNRPRENGASKPQAATVKADIQKLSRADFDEIMRRAARGENIRF